MASVLLVMHYLIHLDSAKNDLQHFCAGGCLLLLSFISHHCLSVQFLLQLLLAESEVTVGFPNFVYLVLTFRAILPKGAYVILQEMEKIFLWCCFKQIGESRSFHIWSSGLRVSSSDWMGGVPLTDGNWTVGSCFL